MKQYLCQMPVSLLCFITLNTALSLALLPTYFIPLLLALISTALYRLKINPTKPQVTLRQKVILLIAYSLVIIGLALIWQSLEIPSLLALSAVFVLLGWAKTCELNSPRDCQLIWLLNSVLLAINILLHAPYQIAIAVIGVASLIIAASQLSHAQVSQASSAKTTTTKPITKSINQSKRVKLFTLIALSLPFAFILFITVPRINLPMQELGLAMGLPIAIEPQQKSGKGLGKELTFDDISDNAGSDERVLLATLPANFQQSPATPLYWRGPVYWRYSQAGQGANSKETWQLRKDFNIRSKRQYNGFGSNKALANMANQRENNINYSVILMPHGEYWLYALDLPSKLTGESYLSQDYQLLSIRTVNKMWRYKSQSSLTYQISEKEPQAQLSLGLQLPNNNPQLIALGKQWQQQLANKPQPAQAIIKQAEQYFTQGKFLYASKKQRYQGENQLDQFLFHGKVGYSQHYASALTLLLRAANIPARLVAGYRGAEKVGLTNLYTVNDHHAHAWVEAYYPLANGQSAWQRIDPSLWLIDLFTRNNNAATNQQTNDELNKQAIQTASPSLVKQSDTAKKTKENTKAQTSWLDGLNQWTLAFDANKQSQLAKKLGINQLLWWHLLAIALALLALLALSIYLVLRFINRGKPQAEHVRIYHKLCTKLAKKGLVRLPHEGAQSYFNRCAQQITEQAPHFALLTQSYLALAYSQLNDAQRQQYLRQFTRLTKAF